MTPATGDDPVRANAEIIKQLGVWLDTHERGAVTIPAQDFFFLTAPT